MRLWLDFFKNLCQSSMMHEGRWVNFLTTVGKLESLTVCWRESTRRTQLSGNQAATAHSSHIAAEDLVLSQEGKPKRHRSARDISHIWDRKISRETVILRSSVDRIIYHDLQLKWFIRRHVVLSCCLKAITSPVSLADKQSYWLQ